MKWVSERERNVQSLPRRHGTKMLRGQGHVEDGQATLRRGVFGVQYVCLVVDKENGMERMGEGVWTTKMTEWPLGEGANATQDLA